MKKIIYLGFFVFAAITLSAQHFDMRFYGGFNIMQLSTDQNLNTFNGVLHERSITGRPGVLFGTYLTFGDRFYVQPGFQYSTISTEIINTNQNTQVDLTDQTTLSVVSVPLKFGLRLLDASSESFINVRLFGGFDGHHVLSVDHSQVSGAEGNIAASDYSNLILNGDLGMGLDLWFLFIDLGYQMGISPVYNSGDQAKINAFYSNIGIRFRF